MTELWQQHAEHALGQRIVQLQRLGGGDFAEAYKARLSDERSIFIKTHSNPPDGFFTTEATGLRWLHDTDSVNIPAVLAISDQPSYLALEWIESGLHNSKTDKMLGRDLAKLHSHSSDCFGRLDQRTTGSLGLPNSPCDTWAEFYATQRLLPLARIANDRQSLPARTVADLEKVAGRLDQFGGSDEAPSLLHGDLWAGNRMVDDQSISWLVDPAAHYGHREFDLAMMHLFGGYGADCFDAYVEASDLCTEWRTRIPLHQLAPLVVHAIKFGGSYIEATESAVQHYV